MLFINSFHCNILLTGFGPFGGELINPALEAIKQLEGQIINNCTIVTRELPVVRYESIQLITRFIKEINPILVIAVGQAGGRPDITFERVAVNVDDFSIPDNAGLQPVDEKIFKDAPTAYFSTLPIKKMVA